MASKELSIIAARIAPRRLRRIPERDAFYRVRPSGRVDGDSAISAPSAV